MMNNSGLMPVDNTNDEEYQKAWDEEPAPAQEADPFAEGFDNDSATQVAAADIIDARGHKALSDAGVDDAEYQDAWDRVHGEHPAATPEMSDQGNGLKHMDNIKGYIDMKVKGGMTRKQAQAATLQFQKDHGYHPSLVDDNPFLRH